MDCSQNEGPREISSKIRLVHQVPVKKNIKCRDPRFHSLCGEFDHTQFKNNYKFINDIKKEEKKILEEKLKITLDPELKKKLKYLIQRIGDQIKVAEEIRGKPKRDKFKKKSENKVDQLIEKYVKLKESNKLEKYIKKRRRKGLNNNS